MKCVSVTIICLCLFYSISAQNISFKTKYLNVGIDGKGNIYSLKDERTNTDYYPHKKTSPLLSLYKDSTYIFPVNAKYNSEGQELILQYSNGSKAVIRISNKQEYLKFELLSLTPRNKIEAVVWGPYATTISQSIGETVCVVRDSSFSIGLQALNINTIEGLPENGDDAGGGSFIDPLPGQKIPDSLKDKIGEPVPVNVNITGDMPDYVRMYRGCAAIKKSFGSQLQLFSRDRRIARTASSGDNKQYVSPINVDFAGSAIAMFGCSADKTLDVIGKIELGEGLPHPMLNGEWIKKSSIPGESYLLYEGQNVAKGMEYAKLCGFKLIHLGDVFQTWGHFGLKTNRFPNGAESIMRTTDLAKKEGISLGVHTLTMFTGANDTYVSPIPNDSLCKAGSTILSRQAGEKDDIIYIEDPVFFRNTDKTHTVKIGKELVNYRAVSDDKPWRLLDCFRGQYNTKISTHSEGTGIDKIMNNDYNGFYPDIHLQDAYSKRLAEICNETGIGLMDFDGFGGGSPTGQGCYGAAKFVDLWYKALIIMCLPAGQAPFIITGIFILL